ncbi:hypothetical protein [Cryobacterium sp. GrIS_2_6]|uniref:hypothetical protein n=1 Tax=Cryobacterium sp. GrIS_2_6 TaxID=3162785 RepID=UPI002E0BC8B0|nr:hypothetical protein [Cryobacterium psychrotolerans]
MLRAALRSRISRTSRIAIEAGRGDAWFRWLDLDGRVVSIQEFSASHTRPRSSVAAASSSTPWIATAHTPHHTTRATALHGSPQLITS